MEVCQAAREFWERTLTEQETPAGDGNTRDAGPRWLGALRFTSEGLTSALDRPRGCFGVCTWKPGGACAGHEASPPHHLSRVSIRRQGPRSLVASSCLWSERGTTLTLGQVGQAGSPPSPTPTQSQALGRLYQALPSIPTLLRCAAVGLEESSRAWIFREPSDNEPFQGWERTELPPFSVPKVALGEL